MKSTRLMRPASPWSQAVLRSALEGRSGPGPVMAGWLCATTIALGLFGCVSGGGPLTLDTQAQQESARCGTPETASPPPGDYADQGLRVRYDKLAPEPDPLSNVDANAVRDTVTDAKRLEQIYYDATHGHLRAAWLLCQLEAGARGGGRAAAEQLASLSCQTTRNCSFRFDQLPFSKDTASGRRLLTIIGREFEAQATRRTVQQEIIGKALGALIGVRMASQLRAEPPSLRTTPRVLDEAVLGEVRGAGAARSFRSFSEFRRAMGSAGPGKEWHHIVEQTPGNVERFGPEALHNTGNVIAIDKTLHQRISALYSSKARVAEGLTVRQWLSSQSFEAQRDFGVDTLRRYGAIP
jgi:hypothetical protein